MLLKLCLEVGLLPRETAESLTVTLFCWTYVKYMSDYQLQEVEQLPRLHYSIIIIKKIIIWSTWHIDSKRFQTCCNTRMEKLYNIFVQEERYKQASLIQRGWKKKLTASLWLAMQCSNSSTSFFNIDSTSCSIKNVVWAQSEWLHRTGIRKVSLVC